MLDNLVESKNNSKAAAKFYGFLFSTFLVVAVMLVSATLWSLFAKDFVMGDDDMALSTLITPIPVDKNEPQPEPVKPKQQSQPQNSTAQIAVRRTNMARIDEAQIAPDKVSIAPNTGKARPNSPFNFDPNAAETEASIPSGIGREQPGRNAPGFSDQNNKTEAIAETPKVNVPKPPPIIKEEKLTPPRTVTLGVVNGKASNLPKPPYPAPARAVGASGAVNVQVLIDETGNVISAKAVTGHPLLRAAAERAARNAKFTPTYLSKIPVKVNGLIVYNFTK